MPPSALPRWLVVISASFASLWVLLFYCDLFRIQPLGFELEANNGHVVVRTVHPGSPAAEAGVRPGDQVLVANGWPVRSKLDLILGDANVRAGAPLPLMLRREETPITLTVAVGAASWRHSRTAHAMPLLLVRLVQLATLGAAVLIAFKRPRDGVALAAAWLLSTAAITSVTFSYRFASTWRALPLPVGLLLVLPFLSKVTIGPAVFTFFTLFPTRKLRKPLLAAALLPVIPAVAWQAALGWRMVWGPPAASRMGEVLPVLLVTNIGYAAVGLALAITGYRHLRDETERRLRVVLIGVMVATSGGAFAFLHYWMADVDITRPLMSDLPMLIGTMLLMTMPLSFASSSRRTPSPRSARSTSRSLESRTCSSPSRSISMPTDRSNRS